MPLKLESERATGVNQVCAWLLGWAGRGGDRLAKVLTQVGQGGGGSEGQCVRNAEAERGK